MNFHDRVEAIRGVARESRLTQRRWTLDSIPKTDAKLHIVQRHSLLRDLEGWYNFHGLFLDSILQVKHPNSLLHQSLLLMQNQLQSYCSTNQLDFNNVIASKLIHGTRLGKFLIEQLKALPDHAAAFIEQIKTGKFRLSCKYNDLVRVGETKHYETCMKQWRGLQLLRFLADPDVCIIYVPDASGKMLCRMFARLLKSTSIDNPGVSVCGQTILGLYRVYGNGLSQGAVAQALHGHIKCASMSRNYGSGVPVVSYSHVHNPAVAKPVWSDHGCTYDPTTKLLRFAIQEML